MREKKNSTGFPSPSPSSSSFSLRAPFRAHPIQINELDSITPRCSHSLSFISLSLFCSSRSLFSSSPPPSNARTRFPFLSFLTPTSKCLSSLSRLSLKRERPKNTKQQRKKKKTTPIFFFFFWKYSIGEKGGKEKGRKERTRNLSSLSVSPTACTETVSVFF